MKKFNWITLASLILTLALQGCMPDSLTKFSKAAPQKAANSTSTTTAPVVDPSGEVISFTPPLTIHYGANDNAVERYE
jgi:gamma-glutamyltranspeptidase